MVTVTYTRQAERSIRRLPRNLSQRIVDNVDQLAADPDSLANNVTELKGSAGLQRLRIGQYRVIFHKAGDSITVLAIEPRGSAYQ